MIEALDRNKTNITHQVTNAAVNWLDEKGFKPVETEVEIGRKWIADVAGVCTPTQTEWINLKLLKRPTRYPFNRQNGMVDEYRQKYDEWMIGYKKLPHCVTAIIEVKTSVQDFTRDQKWNRQPCDLCYVAMPHGMIPESQWPINWGILLFSELGTLRQVRPSPLHRQSTEQRMWQILAIAVRRDHSTRYARLRQFDKKSRLEDVERKSIDRVNVALRFVIRIAEGKSIEEAQMYSGLRVNLPHYMVEKIDEFRVKIAGVDISRVGS